MISSGIASPVTVVITRVLPSTVESAIPGNHVWMVAGSPMIAQTSLADRSKMS